MPDYDPTRNLNLGLMAVAEGAPPGSLGEAFLASCGEAEMDAPLLAAAIQRQLSEVHTRLAVFKFRGGESLKDAMELQEVADQFLIFAAVVSGQADLHVARIAERQSRSGSAKLIDFTGRE